MFGLRQWRPQRMGPEEQKVLVLRGSWRQGLGKMRGYSSGGNGGSLTSDPDCL